MQVVDRRHQLGVAVLRVGVGNHFPVGRAGEGHWRGRGMVRRRFPGLRDQRNARLAIRGRGRGWCRLQPDP